MGSSKRKEKSISIDNGFQCPQKVDKTNWLSGDTYGDTFSVAQTGNRITVTRIDANAGWGLWLTFKCCQTKGKSLVWSEIWSKNFEFRYKYRFNFIICFCHLYLVQENVLLKRYQVMDQVQKDSIMKMKEDMAWNLLVMQEVVMHQGLEVVAKVR